MSFRILLLSLALALPLRAADFKAKAEHVVLVVWDGMQPDFITPETTPTLHALAQSGTFFARNHAAYITTTEVNGTAIATGCYASKTGIMANREYRPDVNLAKLVDTQGALPIRIGDALTGGRWVQRPTLAEIVQSTGHRTAVAGTKPIALLHDRRFDRSASHGSTVIFAGKTYPPTARDAIHSLLGKFPDYPAPELLEPNTAQNRWTARALTESLWLEGVPRFSTMWLGDPDFSQHLTQPGSPTALAAIRNSDDNLALLLAALDGRGVREKTDIFIVSDHGFSTGDRAIDILDLMKKSGFKAFREFKTTPQPGEILVSALGGSCSFYVIGKDEKLIGKLVDWLQRSDLTGPIFTRNSHPGAGTLRDVRMDTATAPDVVFSFRWNATANKSGIHGQFTMDARKPGYGSHGSMSPFDIRNTLVAAGPDIRAGLRSELPSGNVDVAPTILHLLGIPQPEPMDGRVLMEALAAVDWDAPKPVTKTTEITRKIDGKTWRQYLQHTTFADRIYLDEGNASLK